MGEPDYSGVFDAAEERSDIGNAGAWEDAPASEERVSGQEENNVGGESALTETAAQEDDLFQGLGFVNPYTGREISGREDFLEWKRQYAADRQSLEKDSREHEGNADPEGMKKHIDGELEKIRRWDPSIRDLEQISSSDRFEEIYEKVKRGYSLADAFYVVHGERLQKQAADRAEQALRNRLKSKEHLEKTGSRGSSETAVPQEIMREFRRILPKADREEIRKFYRRDQAQLKH